MRKRVCNKIEAIVFDMDGVIIDSEHLWKRAEREVFSSVGVKVSDTLSKCTEAMTTSEVTRFWFDRYPWEGKTMAEIESGVIKRVADLIEQEGEPLPGVVPFIQSLKLKGYKIGVATNSPAALIPIVLQKLGLDDCFDATASAEQEEKGKPDPFVYLTVAQRLKKDPSCCMAIEDSSSGLLAAKRAGMTTVALLAGEQTERRNDLADYSMTDYGQFDFSILS